MSGLRAIVVGAGAAGIAAARALKDEGHQPVVLEARDRIGGRAWSRTDLAPHPVEMGAEFVHGTTGPTWELLERHELGTVFAYRNHGAEVFEHVDGALRDQTDATASSFFDVAEQVANMAVPGEPDRSVAEVLEEAITACRGAHSEDEARLYGNTFTVYVTEDLDEVGVHGIRDEFTADPDSEPDPRPDWNYRVAEGYSALWDELSEGLDIRLSTVVEEIAWGDGRVAVTTSSGPIVGDAAIVTLPLGVLKAGDVRFVPELPGEKLDAVSQLGAGVVNKVVLRFERSFWPDSMGLLFTSLDSQCFWPPGAGRAESSPLLTWWSSGSLARRVAADVPLAIDGALKDLQQIFPDAPLPALRGYDAVCWGTDPYARIAYSFPRVTDDATSPHDALGASAGNLYFAGEATVRPPAAGSVPGAYESGRRAARELMAAASASAP